MNIFTPRKQLKLLILGDDKVGKTTIISKLTNSEYKNSTNFEFYSKILKNSDKEINVNIWDIKGHTSFNQLCNSYIRDSNAFVLVFDVTDPKSFYNIPFWINKIKENNKYILDHKYYPILLIGNKCDLDRKINYEEASKFAIYNELLYCDLSNNLDNNLDNNLEKINSVFNVYLNLVYDINNSEDKQDLNYNTIFFINCENKDSQNKLHLTPSIENLNLLNKKYKNNYCKNCKNLCEIL
jgi:small GTP-binding protein